MLPSGYHPPVPMEHASRNRSSLTFRALGNSKKKKSLGGKRERGVSPYPSSCVLPDFSLRAFLYTDRLRPENERAWLVSGNASCHTLHGAHTRGENVRVRVCEIEIYIFISGKRLRIPMYRHPVRCFATR